MSASGCFQCGRFQLSTGLAIDVVVTSTRFKGKRNRREIVTNSTHPAVVTGGDAGGVHLRLLDLNREVFVPADDVDNRLVDMNLGNEKAVIKHLAVLLDTGKLFGDGDAAVHQFCQKLMAFGWSADKVSRFKSAAISKSRCWNAYDGGGDKGLTVRNRM